ncbi:hypothetical protein [Flavobacterium psychrotrophum]|uniref:hypothetical protein n=1 Tax=Flavobacterium psychrotrophum TaxID=2294119 RepID=UPI000E30D6F7|nr:hypothetical protein [Flavobacterium psychrotrophum]
MKLKTFYLLAFASLGLCSCSNLYEVHYFKDKISSSSSTKVIPNYYKVEIRAHSFLSSSRYLSGYFDQSAINLYFNEFTQPANGKLFGNNESSSAFTDEKGNELVLIFSTNSKAVSDQIGAIAKNQVVLNSAATVFLKDKFDQSRKLSQELDNADNDKNTFIFQANAYLKDITTKTEAEQKLAIQQLIQTLN